MSLLDYDLSAGKCDVSTLQSVVELHHRLSAAPQLDVEATLGLQNKASSRNLMLATSTSKGPPASQHAPV